MRKMVRVLDNFMAGFEKRVLSFGIILLSLVVIMNILTRVFFKWSWIGTEEFSKFCVIWITFIGAGLGAREGLHISMNAFVDMVSTRMRNNILIAVEFMSALFCFWMAYLGFWFMQLSLKGGMVSPALMLPLWPFYLPLPIGMFLTGIQYIRLAIRRIGSMQEHFMLQETSNIE
jgi:C4-dicarboxylate transporter, DctQ subunit